MGSAGEQDQQAVGLDAIADVYAELRRLAAWHLRTAGPGTTVQPTVLVHEAYLRLTRTRAGTYQWSSRTHFFQAAALAMRRALVDWARSSGARRRHHEAAALMQAVHAPVCAVFAREDIHALERALGELEAEHPRWAAVAVYRWHLGLTVPQTAEVLSVSERTVSSDWRFAQAWLRARVIQLNEERRREPGLPPRS